MAILKQYVEIEKNEKVDHWHPECYMIQKVYYAKVNSKRFFLFFNMKSSSIGVSK